MPNVGTEERVRKLVCLVWRAESSQKTQDTPQADHTNDSHADTSWFDEKWCYDAWNDDSVGTKVNSEDSFLWEFILLVTRAVRTRLGG